MFTNIASLLFQWTFSYNSSASANPFHLTIYIYFPLSHPLFAIYKTHTMMSVIAYMYLIDDLALGSSSCLEKFIQLFDWLAFELKGKWLYR